MIPVDGKAGPADVCVIELGGTIGTYSNNCVLDLWEHELFLCFSRVITTCHDAGDIESMPFIEALGQFSYRVGKDIAYATSYNKIV